MLEVLFWLSVALIVYPQTLDHYAVLLLPAIVALHRSDHLALRLAAAATPLLVALPFASRHLPGVLAAAAICA